MRALLVLMIAAVGFGLGAAGGAAQEATPQAGTTVERTDVRYFLPYGPDGLAPGLAVAREIDGSCDETSLANIGRPDAWFCFETGTDEIHDPCYENPFGPSDGPTVLACVASPFAGEAVLLTTDGPLPREKDSPAAMDGAPDGEAVEDAADDAVDPLSLPWAMELANGTRCGLLTGATAAVAGMRLNYGCEGGGWVVGDLHRGSSVWTANFYDKGSLSTELVEVATVWT